MKFQIAKILTIATLGFFAACSDDINMGGESPTGITGVEYSDIPVEVFAECGEDGFATRGVEGAKQGFDEGDIIHVEARFIDKDGQPIPLEYNKEGEPIRYCAYQAFKKGGDATWGQLGVSAIFWPVNAKYGEFRAYFVKDIQLSLEVADRPHELRLSDIEDNTDPLYAFTEKIDWGHRVNLRFKHLCTHLTFKNLDPDITDYFWLINKKPGVQMPNVFTLKTTGAQELKGEFVSVPDEVFNNLVYVQRRSENVTDVNGTKTASNVSFYLKPGDYSDIELRTINNYAYLAYKSEATADMQENTPYEIDIIKNKGVSYVEDEDNWEDDINIDWIEVDPDDFLSTLAQGNEDYVKNVKDDEGNDRTVTILRKTPEGWLLCYNVYFTNKDRKDSYSLPNIIFDGGNHYIRNVTQNLFSTNNGTIRRLGLKDVDCDVKLWKTDEDHSEWGVVCEKNAGVIENMRLESFSISYTLSEGYEDSGTVFDLGAITGWNTGIVSDVTYDNVVINSKEPQTVKSTLNIGGLVGQSLGPIKNISPVTNNSSLSVAHQLTGDLAVVYIGGVVGQSTALLENIIAPKVTVDSSSGTGKVCNAGGIVGRLRATGGDPSEMINCTVNGSVKGYKVDTTSSSLNAYSYTGGIAGYVYNYNVSNCRTICEVEGAAGVNSESGTVYATGGGFGRIQTIDNNIHNNYIGGSKLTGPSSYIGNFAGITPLNSESKYQEAGNDVKNLGHGFIGATINGNPDD
ncbi:MAG: hypothetical protein J1D77_02675 [Muribaculaceae bacterium]|nr:hypothetical protein [Muribaculaceae bacterium]